MKIVNTLSATALALAVSSGAALSQDADTIVVFDGSGSMWGQINGRTKIEIARDTLSQVLTEIPAQSRIGMIAYGHRQKGVCSDIETVVPVSEASQSVAQMIGVANALQPKGKTPLTDAVRIAAEELKFTENAATVILVTDGIETCDADPCALGRQLESAGIGFTAHVVGFGLSEEEGQQVQCLADNTGGLYLSANNADELGAALRQTVQAVEINEDDFGPLVQTRNVRFIFRDTPNGDQIGIRQLTGMLEKADGSPVEEGSFVFAYPEASGNSATALLEPGSYTGVFRRDGGSRGGYDVRYSFDIPEGEGEHLVEASLSGSLRINPFINPNLPYDPTDLPQGSVKSNAWAYFSIYPVVDGAVSEEAVVSAAYSKLNFPLPSGTYLVRGNIDRTTSAEQMVTVNGETEVDFSFDVTRVFVSAVETNGAPVKRQTTFWYDKVPSGRNYWSSGSGVSKSGVTPFYLPTGTWITNVGGEGYGARRSQVVVQVPGDFQDIRLTVGESETLSDAQKLSFESGSYTGCVEIVKVKYNGCMVKTASAPASSTPNLPVQPSQEAQPDQAGTNLGLNGLSGTAYAFVDKDQQPKLHVVFEPGNTQAATIVLSDAWCGLPQCEGDRFPIEYDEVDLLLEDGFSAKTASANSYNFAISTFGQDKEIAVSGAGAARVPFTFFDTIELGATPAAVRTEAPVETQAETQTEPGAETAKPVSIEDQVNRVFGVFSLDKSGASPETITADFAHTQTCQRRPVVIYPDNTIAFKQFEPPQSATDNPFKTVASGSCNVSGSSYECAVTDKASGQTETMSFTSQFLGNNHYNLTMAGEAAPTLAASCFFPGGAMQAATMMPNGRALSDLVLERADNAAAGMGYDSNNNAFRGN